MPRHARLDSPGTLHHVMVRGIEQRQIADGEADRADFVRRLGALAALEWEFGLALRGTGPTGVIKSRSAEY